MARLTLSPRDVVCAHFHLLEDSLRLDITSRHSRNLRLLLRLLQSDLFEPVVNIEPVVAAFIVEVRLVAMELLCCLLRLRRKVFQRRPYPRTSSRTGFRAGTPVPMETRQLRLPRS